MPPAWLERPFENQASPLCEPTVDARRWHDASPLLCPHTPAQGACSGCQPAEPVRTFSSLSGFPGLTCLPAGQSPPHPSGLSSSEGDSLSSHHHPGPLRLSTRRPPLPRAGSRLPPRLAHSLLSARTALSATVAHPLSGDVYLMPLSLDHIFLILCVSPLPFRTPGLS